MANKFDNGEGQINHYNGVRLRVNGSGSLKLRLLSLDEVRERVLLPLEMSTLTNREPFRKANFKEQRVQLEIKTTEINEVFVISSIIFFVKPSASNYPG